MKHFYYNQMEKENNMYSNEVISECLRNKLFCLTHEFNPQVVCYIQVSMEKRKQKGNWVRKNPNKKINACKAILPRHRECLYFSYVSLIDETCRPPTLTALGIPLNIYFHKPYKLLLGLLVE